MSNSKPFRPLLAAKTPPSLDVLDDYDLWPLLCSPKLDGIRAIVRQGVVYSRTMKPIPSEFAQKNFGREEYEGLDGELIIPRHLQAGETIYHDTYSSVMTHNCTDPLEFQVFDRIPGPDDRPDEPYIQRLGKLALILEYQEEGGPLKLVPQLRIHNPDELQRLEEEMLDDGYEGLIMRREDKPYKFGRSTLKEGILIKLARWETSEAIVLRIVQMMRNANEAVVGATGYTERSSKMEGLVAVEMAGALCVRDCKTGVEFEIGTGFDHALREEIWKHPQAYINRIAKYRFKPYGTKERPRQPSFIGWRDPMDM